MPKTKNYISEKNKKVVKNVPEANYVADLLRRCMKAQQMTTEELGERIN